MAVPLVALAVLLSGPHWAGPVRWTPDGLFYEAQRLEVQGLPAQRARRRVFSSAAAVAVERTWPFVRNRRWVRYSAVFYRRRWLVPALAAAIAPVFGDRSILIVSLAAYLALGPLLYLLLRRDFPSWAAAAASAGCLLLPPLRDWAFRPLTDSTGLALLVACLIAVPGALRRGRLPLLAWTAAIAALALTRDSAVILLVAAALMLLSARRRAWLRLLVTAAAGVAVPALLFPFPVRKEIAYTLNGHEPVASPSWSYILDRYPHGLLAYLHADADWVVRHPATGLVCAVAVVASVVWSVRGGRDRLLLPAYLVGAILFLCSNPNWTEMRLELVLVPLVAYGFAVIVSAVGTQLRQVASPRRAAGTCD